MKTVKIVNKSGNSLPKYETEGAAGMDIKANIASPIYLYPQQKAIIPTGIFVEIPKGYEIQIRSKSGLAAKKGVIVLNSPGTIDSDYRGEIGVILFNSNPWNSKVDHKIEHGDKIAQMVLKEVEQIEWEEVEELSETKRGDGGFGSTDKE